MPDLDIVLSGDEFVRRSMEDGLSLLRLLNIPFAITGAVALSQYAPARFTYDIDILVSQDSYDQAISWALALQRQKSGSARDQVGIKIIPARKNSELLALNNARDATILCTCLKVVPPEHLLWIYCGSKELQHLADAIPLVRANPWVENITRANIDSESTEKAALNLIMDGVRRSEQSSYSERVKKRLS